MSKSQGVGDRALGLVARVRQEGQALAEHSLILAFALVPCALALGFLGGALAGHLDALAAPFP